MNNRTWRSARLLLPACIAMLLALSAVQMAIAEQTATVRLVLSAPRVTPGGSVTAEVRIEGAPHLCGAEVHLSFDPAKLQVQDATPQTAGVQIQAGSLLDPGFTPGGNGNAVDNVQGRIDFARVALPCPADSVIVPDGVLARIIFNSIGEGETSISFTSVSLLDNKAVTIPAQPLGATLVIGAPLASQTPSPTLPPTARPTPTAAPPPPDTPAPTPPSPPMPTNTPCPP